MFFRGLGGDNHAEVLSFPSFFLYCAFSFSGHECGNLFQEMYVSFVESSVRCTVDVKHSDDSAALADGHYHLAP